MHKSTEISGDHYPWSDWMLFVLYLCSIFLALTSNSIVLAIFFKKKKTKTSATYRLMSNMAISDLLCSSFIILQWYFCSSVFFSDDLHGSIGLNSFPSSLPIGGNQSTIGLPLDSRLDSRLDNRPLNSFSGSFFSPNETNPFFEPSKLHNSSDHSIPLSSSPNKLHLNLDINLPTERLPTERLPTDEAIDYNELLEKTIEKTLENTLEKTLERALEESIEKAGSNKFAGQSDESKRKDERSDEIKRSDEKSDKIDIDETGNFGKVRLNSLEIDRLEASDNHQVNKSADRPNDAKLHNSNGAQTNKSNDHQASRVDRPAHLNNPFERRESLPNNRLQAGQADTTLNNPRDYPRDYPISLNGPRLANQALNSKSSSDDSSAAIDWENQFISDRVIKTNNEHNHYSASESANPINGELSNDRAVNKPLGRTGEQKRNVEHSEHNGEQSSKQNDQKNDQKNGKKNSQPNGDRNGHQTAKRTSEQGVQPGSPQSAEPGNRIKELHQRSLADLAANLESEPQFRKKRDFEQSTSRRGLSTGEPIESADLNRPAAFESADDSSLAAVHNSNDEAPRGSTEQDASNGSSGPNGSSGSTGSQPNGPSQTTDRKPAQLRLKEKLRNFVIKNKDRLMKSRFISQMPNCGQRICAILETLQMSTYYVSTLTMAGIAYNRYNLINRPLAPKMDTTLFITTIWLTSLSMASLASLSSLRVFVFFTSTRFIDCRIILSSHDADSWELRKWRAIILMAVQYILPLSFISVLYSQVIKELRKGSLVRTMHQSSTSSNNSTLQHAKSADQLLGRRFSNPSNGLPGVGVQSGVPSGISSGTPSGVPNGFQSGISNGIPNGIQNSISNGIPNSIPNGIPYGLPQGVHSIQNGTINRGFSHTDMFRVSLDERPEINNNDLDENLENFLENDLKLRSLEHLDDNLNEPATKFTVCACLRRFSLANLPLFREKTRKQTAHSDDLPGRPSSRHESGEKTRHGSHQLGGGRVEKFRQGVRLDRMNDQVIEKVNDKANDRVNDRANDKANDKTIEKVNDRLTNYKLDGDQLARLVNKRLMNGRLMNQRSSSNESHSTFASSQSYHSQSVSAKLNLLNSELDRTKRRLTTMMIIVVLVFATAWLPVHLFHIKQFLVDSYDDFNYCDSSPLYLLFYFIAFSTNTYNPIIYFYFSKELRRDAILVLKSVFANVFKIKKILKGCNC